MKKDLFSPNLQEQITQSEISNAHLCEGIQITSKDEPPVIVVPPSKINGSNFVTFPFNQEKKYLIWNLLQFKSN